MIERQIIIGLIVSIEFLQQVRPIWKAKILKSVTAQRLGQWCIEYFDKYHKAPEKAIETIYHEKLREGHLQKDLAEDLEEMIAGLSDEYEESFNLQYILDKTSGYFKERDLEIHQQQIKDLIDRGEVGEAELVASAYTGISVEISNDLDLSDPNIPLKVENAFKELARPLIKYPGALGSFWNHQLVPGAFIGLMAREKLGKTFWLLDMGIRAARQGTNVAFFQAGDMTENQQIKRIASYLTKKPLLESYCGDVFLPMIDCERNQLDVCEKSERECDFGVFANDNLDAKSLRKEINMEKLQEAFTDEPDYNPCRNCEEFKRKALGVPWIRKIEVKYPVRVVEATKKIFDFFVEKKRRFKLSTY